MASTPLAVNWESALKWISDNQVGDLASIAGVIIAVIGFAWTIRSARKAKEAAEAARESIRRFDAVVDFSTAITTLEDIKRLHRDQAWPILPERYAALRKLLILARSSFSGLDTSQRKIIQTAIQDLTAMEIRVEKSLRSPATLDVAKLNATLSGNADRLIELLAQLKVAQAGGPNDR